MFDREVGVTTTTANTSATTVGWREWASIPEWGVPYVKAKLDSGARTSALHAIDVEYFERDDADWVRFTICPWQRNRDDAVTVEVPQVDQRVVTSSSGSRSERPVVRIPLVVASVIVDAEVTLTRRDEMGFRMLIGRQALRQGLVVDSARSYVGGRPPKPVRVANRRQS